jgi:hypothetical protein
MFALAMGYVETASEAHRAAPEGSASIRKKMLRPRTAIAALHDFHDFRTESTGVAGGESRTAASMGRMRSAGHGLLLRVAKRSGAFSAWRGM